ncbi:MAG: 2-hydroxyacid dehydrogenase [Actinomycetota bacterium]|nr:2-hydroxyacid dehydrogenase [Actinomycetota bacterium]
MLSVLLPSDMRPADVDVRMDDVDFDGVRPHVDLTQVGFYVAPYLGPPSTLDLIRRMPNLQVVQLLTAGFDAALPIVPPNVVLCNAAGVHDASTAELAVGLILASLRGIDDFARAMPDGTWLHARRPSLADRRILILGVGGVGRAIAARLEPFETDLILMGRTARPGIRGAEELDDLLPWADIVVVAVPLNSETTLLVDDAFLGRMRDTALLVNMARGSVVDTNALLHHVQSGRLRAAMDVTDPEPLPADHPLWRTPGVLVSPHVGGDTSAFVPRARLLVEAQIRRWLNGEQLGFVVNTP